MADNYTYDDPYMDLTNAQAPAYNWGTIGAPLTADQLGGGSDNYVPPSIAGIDSAAYAPQYGTTQGAGYSYDDSNPVDSGFSLGNAAQGVKDWWNGLDGATKARLIGGGLAGLDALTGHKLSGGAAGGGASHSFSAIPSKTMKRTRLDTPVNGRYFSDVTYAAHGGLMPGGIAEGMAHGGRYLQGPTDGMADKLDTSIDGQQPAKLSHGEFVIPADVVSHLGNGNSDAGAKMLYQMMSRIRKARTGTAKQGKQIDPHKYMPGGLAALAEGGEVKGFSGTTGSAVGLPAGTTGVQTGVSDWAAPYVGNMLGNAAAVANSPYEAYSGPLTAGPSALQTQVSQGLQGIQTPANYGKSFTDTGVSQQYMNPYLQNALTPQLDELRRQSQITQTGNDAKMTQAGAFGGDRQALLTAETQRNLGQQQEQTTANAYNTAYNTGMQQFNTEQGQAQNLLGLKANVGATDQNTEQQGITANVNAFNAERDDPMKKLAFQKSMLDNMPISSTDYTIAQPSIIDQMAGGALGGDALWNSIFNPKKSA